MCFLVLSRTLANDFAKFAVYRLNIADALNLFNYEGPAIRTDDDVGKVLDRATVDEFDVTRGSAKSRFKWSAREFSRLAGPDKTTVFGVTMARSVVEQIGPTVTDTEIVDAISETHPPQAAISHLLFFMARHLVAVEYNSALISSTAWRTVLHQMLDRAAVDIGFRSYLRLEPVPQDEEILQAFKSFTRLIRLRVNLRIPNPELSPLTRKLRADMEQGGIREYLNDMRNPSGISQREGDLPLACAAMAQQGYKDGEVRMDGIRNGRRETIRTGREATRIDTDVLKAHLRGLTANAHTKEGTNIVASVLKELERAVTPPGESIEEQ